MQITIEWNRKLGEGGEGEVYFGLIDGHQKCAIKFLHGYNNPAVHPMLRIKMVESIRRERDRGLRAIGTRLVRMLASNDGPELPYVVYEFASGGTLGDMIERLRKNNSRLHIRDVLARGEDLLTGLVELHANGLIHRDIKPDNILCFEDGTAKIADLGLGRSLDRPCDKQTRAFVGTRMFAAPEQIEKRCLDDRTDLFGVGGVLWMLLTNSPPPSRRPLPTLVSLRATTPPALGLFVNQLFAHDSRKRPSTASAALATIRQIRKEYELAQLRAKGLAPCACCGKIIANKPCSRCNKVHCPD